MALPPFPIETARLLLRPFEATDHGAVLAYQGREDVNRYMHADPSGADELREMLARRMAESRLEQEGDVLDLAAVLREDGRLVGDVTLFYRSAEHRQAEVAYVFHPDVHGRGLATEATEALLQIAFEGLACHRVYGRLDARNAASARVLEKAGMRLEGRLVENERDGGEWTDELIYAVLDREWLTATGRTGSP